MQTLTSIPFYNEFIVFLKKNKIYARYMRAFKKPIHGYLLTTHRPVKFSTYIKTLDPVLWIVRAFMWEEENTERYNWNKINFEWNQVIFADKRTY